MSRTIADESSSNELLLLASDPDLRRLVYDHLRDYCHQCRNRLNSLKLSIYLAMKQAPAATADRWQEIDRHYQDLERRVEQVQSLCRPLSLSRVILGLELLFEDRREAWEKLMTRAGRALELVPPAERAVASFDVECLGRSFDSLVAWRSTDRSASGPVRLRWWVEAGFAHISWEEPASGPPATEGVAPDDPSFWTLPLLARVVLAHGGDYQLSTDRGWRLEVAWPSQPPTPRA